MTRCAKCCQMKQLEEGVETLAPVPDVLKDRQEAQLLADLLRSSFLDLKIFIRV